MKNNWKIKDGWFESLLIISVLFLPIKASVTKEKTTELLERTSALVIDYGVEE